MADEWHYRISNVKWYCEHKRSEWRTSDGLYSDDAIHAQWYADQYDEWFSKYDGLVDLRALRANTKVSSS